MVRATRSTLVNARATTQAVHGGFNQLARITPKSNEALQIGAREQRVQALLQLQLPGALVLHRARSSDALTHRLGALALFGPHQTRRPRLAARDMNTRRSKSGPDSRAR